MRDPQIRAIHKQMSEEKAVAVLHSQIGKGVDRWGFRSNGYSTGFGMNGYDGSVDPTGFVIKRAIQTSNPAPGVMPIMPRGTRSGYIGNVFYFKPTYALVFVPGDPLPDRTIAFAEVNSLHFLAKFYHLYDSDGVFWEFNVASKDKSEFLAALFFLCPNIRGH